MKFDHTEKMMMDEKYRHLTEDELYSYHAQALDAVGQARADAHLKLCLRCGRDLDILKQERARPENRQVTASDIAMVRRLRQEQASELQRAKAGNEVPIKDLFTGYLGQLVDSWQSYFRQKQKQDGWQWESKDGRMRAYVVSGEDAGLTIHFTSDDVRLEGTSFNVHLGSINRMITLQLVSDSEVYAKVDITRYQLPINLAAIKIEPFS